MKLALLVASSLLSPASSFYTGDMIFALCHDAASREFVADYVMGVYDGLEGRAPAALRYCPPEGLTGKQLANVVCQALNTADPTIRANPAGTILLFAFASAFPCR